MDSWIFLYISLPELQATRCQGILHYYLLVCSFKESRTKIEIRLRSTNTMQSNMYVNRLLHFAISQHQPLGWRRSFAYQYHPPPHMTDKTLKQSPVPSVHPLEFQTQPFRLPLILTIKFSSSKTNDTHERSRGEKV